MATDFKALEAKVREGGTPEQSATILVNGLADALTELTHDPVAIQALAIVMRNNAAALASAVCATKPAAGSQPTQQSKPEHPAQAGQQWKQNKKKK
jgi:hypothetical protein